MAGPQRLPFYVARTFGFSVLANCIHVAEFLDPILDPSPEISTLRDETGRVAHAATGMGAPLIIALSENPSI